MTTMNYRRLGRSGLKVSELSFGSWVTYGNQMGEDVARECMRAAYDAGVNFFDNAEVYAGGRSETIMGDVLKKAGDRETAAGRQFNGGLGTAHGERWNCDARHHQRLAGG